jgi:hypothetical protein
MYEYDLDLNERSIPLYQVKAYFLSCDSNRQYLAAFWCANLCQ